MRDKYSHISGWLILNLLGLLSIIIGICSIVNYSNSPKEYTAPVYISEKFSVQKSDIGWCITGQIKNLTNKDIVIQSANIYCTGRSGNNQFTANYKMSNILVCANSYTNICESDLRTSSGMGVFSSAKLTVCTINDVQYYPKYSSDGKHFHNMPNASGGIIFLVLGTIMVSIYIFHKIKEKH